MQTLFEIYLTNVRQNFEIPLALDVISSGFAGGPHHSQLNDRLMSRPNICNNIFCIQNLDNMVYLVFCMMYLVCGMAREKLDPCSIWGFPEAASSLLGLTDEMARKVFCHFHFHFLHICLTFTFSTCVWQRCRFNSYT